MNKHSYASGDWVTYEDGSVEMINTDIRFGDTYYIDYNNRLDSFKDIDNWIEHMERKTWWTIKLRSDMVKVMIHSLEIRKKVNYQL